jgi:hypothetical protein
MELRRLINKCDENFDDEECPLLLAPMDTETPVPAILCGEFLL